MLIGEVIVLSVAAAITLIVDILLYLRTNRMPLLEAKLLTFGIFLIFFSFIFLLPSAVLNEKNRKASDVALFLYKVQFVLIFISLLFIFLAFTLPDFKENYQSIAIYAVFPFFLSAAALSNFLTVKHKIIGARLLIIHDPLGLLLTILTIIFIGLIFIQRFLNIREILKKAGLPFVSKTTVFTFLLSLFLVIILLIIPLTFPSISLPTFTWSLMSAVSIVIFGHMFLSFKESWFVTSSELEKIAIFNKKTGRLLISYDFRSQTISKDELERIFTTLNYSLKATILSAKELLELNFGDKVIVVSPGSIATTLVIVSENNLLVKSISRFITKHFENMYSDLLKQHAKLSHEMLETDIFREFQTVIDRVRLYIPL